jgi:guanylate kinase
LVEALVDAMPMITVSISHTTRPQRPGEIHGMHYYFIDQTVFQSMVDDEAFLEHAVIFDYCYGTSKHWVEQTLAQGTDVILEIDWQGYQQIKQLFPHAIGIFVLPPSLADLQSRLSKRNQDHPEIIRKRLADVQETISHLAEFDYVVVNDEFSKALHDLKTIVAAGRLSQKRQALQHAQLIQSLSGGPLRKH